MVTDGEQIFVASQAEQAESLEAAHGADERSNANQSASSGATTGAGLVNINTASLAELESLPGVGEITAQRIISDRQANGSFKTIEDLKRVSGIGDKKFESLSGLICV